MARSYRRSALLPALSLQPPSEVPHGDSEFGAPRGDLAQQLELDAVGVRAMLGRIGAAGLAGQAGQSELCEAAALFE